MKRYLYINYFDETNFKFELNLSSYYDEKTLFKSFNKFIRYINKEDYNIKLKDVTKYLNLKLDSPYYISPSNIRNIYLAWEDEVKCIKPLFE